MVYRWPTPLAALRRSIISPYHAPFTSKPSSTTYYKSLCTSTPTHTPHATSFLRNYRLVIGLGLPIFAVGGPILSAWLLDGSQDLRCDDGSGLAGREYARATTPSSTGPATEVGIPSVVKEADDYEEEESILNLKDLSFGTVAGICVGIFLKKGAKIVAFGLGGTFILLQYFASRSFINIDWSRITSSYEKTVGKNLGPRAKAGGNRLMSLGEAMVDFVTFKFQSRATLLLGIALGFRLG